MIFKKHLSGKEASFIISFFLFLSEKPLHPGQGDYGSGAYQGNTGRNAGIPQDRENLEKTQADKGRTCTETCNSNPGSVLN